MELELALTTILAAVVVLIVAAQLSRVPYPILLVVGGLALGLLPPMPEVELDPDLVLIVILPPLLYAAAYFTPLRELRRNVREISALAVGLVLATSLKGAVGGLGPAIALCGVAPLVAALVVVPRLPETADRRLDDISPSEPDGETR